MARVLTSRHVGLAVGSVVLLAACSAPLPGPESTTEPSAPATTRSEPATSGPTPDLPDPPPQTPLVLAVHASRAPLDVPVEVAERLLAGAVTNWSELGGPAAPLQVVASPVVEEAAAALRVDTNAAAIGAAQSNLDVVALLPGPVVGPTVRVLSVGGVDPFRDPQTYALTTRGLPPDDVVTMSFVGDVMLARGVGQVIESTGDPARPLRATAERLAAADVTIGTLEGTLSRIGPPTQGGDSFGADPSVRAGLTLAGFDVLSVAANHLGDFGTESIVETVRLVRETGIAPVGGGADLAEAETPVIIERNGTKIGVLAFNAIGETPRAAPGVPGALEVRMGSRTGPLVPADVAAMQDRVRALDEQVDVVVVMPHWGTQYTNEPEPDQRTVARAMIHAGADLIVGGHPHWVQGVESYNGVVVAHSLGNYVFDMDFMAETMEGTILDVTLWDGEVRSATFAPIRMDASFTPHQLPVSERESVLDLLWAASAPPFARPQP